MSSIRSGKNKLVCNLCWIVLLIMLLGIYIGYLEHKETTRVINITKNADELICCIYEYRRTKMEYPHDLSMLKSVLVKNNRHKIVSQGIVSKYEYNTIGNTWQYLYNDKEGNSPLLIGFVQSHKIAVYEFRSARKFYTPAGKDEGWAVNYEGTVYYLRSLSECADVALQP